MKRNLSRLTTAITTAVVCFCILSVRVFATSGSDEISQMNEDIMYWYYLIRNNIATPLLILSFAASGFQIFGSAFTTKSGAIDKATHRMYISLMATAVLFLLPYILGAALELVEDSAWSPTTTYYKYTHPYGYIRRLAL